MVAQFPESSTLPNAWLIPKISISANIIDVGTSQIENGLTISRHSRVAEIEVIATNIEINLLNNTVERIFGYLINTINNNVNIA